MSEANVPFLFKKRNNVKKNISRTVQKEESGSSSEDGTKVIRSGLKKRRGLIQSSNKRFKLMENGESTDSSSSDEANAGYKSKRETVRSGPSDMGATATLEIETERDRDAQAVFERSLDVNKQQKGEVDDKVYRGMNNYSKFYEKKDSAAGSASSGGVRSKGPIRAPDHIRSTVRWDYQPDLCKDYKETGFCGFGDSCKFLHDRTDYKLGWQLEMESNKKTNQFGEDSDEENYEIPSDDEHLPFKCLFCRQSFENPVVTKCNHYYCEKCALEHHKKKRTCYVCGENTLGIFKSASELMVKLKQRDEEVEED